MLGTWSITKRRIVAALLFAFGGFGFVGSVSLLIPAWQAAHGGGRVGTFTLTEFRACDRYEPPQQRCGWFGDFVSDDGTVVRPNKELSGGLPPGAKLGDTIPARDTGSLTQIYQRTDTQAWKEPAGLAACFAGLFLAGIVVLRWPRFWVRTSKA